MTTEMKKVWFVDGQIIEQEIPESDIYKQEPFGYFQYDIRLDAWVQNRINNKGAAFYTAGDIRALKHRIHELEGELIGYKKIVADQDALLERQTARIVELQEHIENFDGEDR
jgi:hypothetical protein